jgi:hypothetical protein
MFVMDGGWSNEGKLLSCCQAAAAVLLKVLCVLPILARLFTYQALKLLMWVVLTRNK